MIWTQIIQKITWSGSVIIKTFNSRWLKCWICFTIFDIFGLQVLFWISKDVNVPISFPKSVGRLMNVGMIFIQNAVHTLGCVYVWICPLFFNVSIYTFNIHVIKVSFNEMVPWFYCNKDAQLMKYEAQDPYFPKIWSTKLILVSQVDTRIGPINFLHTVRNRFPIIF